MNGIHDMGGMQDMGPIEVEKNEPVFHAPWEARVYAMARAVAATGKLKGGAIELGGADEIDDCIGCIHQLVVALQIVFRHAAPCGDGRFQLVDSRQMR